MARAEIGESSEAKQAGVYRLLLGVSLSLGLLIGCGEGVEAPKESEPVPVVVSPVQVKTIHDRIEALGTLRANESVVLSALVTETVTDIHFEDGQRVEQGKVLVEMTSAEEKAQLRDATSRAEEAERQYQRVQPLAEGGAAPLSLVDQRRREYETAKAQLEAVRSRLEDRIIVAPFSGVLGLRNVSSGALVSPGDEITTLDDDSVMKLDFTVPATYLPALTAGMPIIAESAAFPERPFRGTVSSIGSRVDPVTRSITVRALIPNEERILKPGLLMTVELLKNERETMLVPEGAIIPEGEDNYLYVVKEREGKSVAERQTVTLGTRRAGEAEILDGVKPNDEVIVHGTLHVRPGQEVKVSARQDGGQSLKDLLKQGSNNSNQEAAGSSASRG